MGIERSTFSVTFFMKKTRLAKDGEAPLFLRVTVNGQSVDISIKRRVAVQDWNQSRETCTAKNKMAMELNHYLGTVKARVLQIHRELEVDGKTVTAYLIRDKYLGRAEDQKTLLMIYKEHNDRCEALIGKDFASSTVEKFKTSFLCLQEYIKHHYNKEDISLNELNNQFISNFEFFMKTRRNMQHNSAIKHLKNLKKIVRIAQANDLIRKDPFAGIQFKHEEVTTEFLTKEELQILINKEIVMPRMEVVRDVFVFCCFTGLAFIDVKMLTPQHLIKDNEGNMWIRKSRQKTKNMCNIPVLSHAKQILEKYADHPECVKNNVLLPVMSNQKVNAYLKEIADICGINKKLTTHVARHTCATVVLLANEVSMENVAKILGHSNTKMTQHYAKVLDSSILRDIKNVEKSMSGITL